MLANCPCDKTASAPCSMVSLILSCFSSLREICSATRALLNGFEYAIVTQDGTDKPVRNPLPGRGFTFPAEKLRAIFSATRTVLLWNHENCLYSLWRRASAQRHGVWQAFESTIQVFEMREKHDR